MTNDVFDLMVIGGGPAGYTAGIYAARAGLKTAIFERLSAGGQMALTDRIENYPGYDDIDGVSLGEKMRSSAEKAGAKTISADVQAVNLKKPIKILETDVGSFQGKSVILAAGANPRKLGIPNEDEWVGRGISYCAVCDGMFYKGKTAAIVGGGNTAATDAILLSQICKKVYLIHRRDHLRASEIYQQKLKQLDNVEILWNSKVTEVCGEETFTGVRIQDTENGRDRILDCDVVFAAIGRIPATEIFSEQLKLDPQGYILTDADMATELEGVFAAGDIRAKELRQIVTAAADGAIAANAAEKYLIQRTE